MPRGLQVRRCWPFSSPTLRLQTLPGPAAIVLWGGGLQSNTGYGVPLTWGQIQLHRVNLHLLTDGKKIQMKKPKS